jgi:hypothetical protein
MALRWMASVFAGGSTALNYGMEIRFFYHSPPQFQDTTNLSVVTFIQDFIAANVGCCSRVTWSAQAGGPFCAILYSSPACSARIYCWLPPWARRRLLPGDLRLLPARCGHHL